MKILITTHDGLEEAVEVETYDAQDTADIINGVTKNDDNNPFSVLVLGQNIYSCINIKNIRMEDE